MVQPFLRIAGRRIDLTQPDQCVFPRDAVKKQDVITYYRTIARVMLRHINDRPLTIQAFHHGVDKDEINISTRPSDYPGWIPTATVPTPQGQGSAQCIMAATPPDLVFLANQGMVGVFMGLSRIDRIRYPDRMIFNLQPANADFSKLQHVAVRLKRYLEGAGLTSFIQTTGGSGAHLAVPIKRTATFEEVRNFAEQTASDIAGAFPDIATVSADKQRRGERVFIDCSLNAYDKRVIVPYSLRGTPGATVATPLDWKELGAADLSTDKYTMNSILRRLAQKSDPWEGMNRRASNLKKAGERVQTGSLQSGAA